jgi:hypothetical protein
MPAKDFFRSLTLRTASALMPTLGLSAEVRRGLDTDGSLCNILLYDIWLHNR